MTCQRWLMLGFLGLLSSACFGLQKSEGGGQTMTPASREVSSGDVALPAGYTIEPIATRLTFPTSITFDDRGDAYVTESGYAYGEVFTVPRLLRLRERAAPEVIASGDRICASLSSGRSLRSRTMSAIERPVVTAVLAISAVWA